MSTKTRIMQKISTQTLKKLQKMPKKPFWPRINTVWGKISTVMIIAFTAFCISEQIVSLKRLCFGPLTAWFQYLRPFSTSSFYRTQFLSLSVLVVETWLLWLWFLKMSTQTFLILLVLLRSLLMTVWSRFLSWSLVMISKLKFGWEKVDQLFLILRLVWSGKGYHPGCDHSGAFNSRFSV